MAEQTFKSPGFFEREIEIISTTAAKGQRFTPFGVIGTAEKGPAFLPVTVNSLQEFKKRFGRITDDMPAGHAVGEFFNNKGDGGAALTFMRVLGTGNDVSSDSDFENKGIVPNAGFFVEGSKYDVTKKHQGAVQFIVADHKVDSNELFTLGHFNDNDSITTDLRDNDGAAAITDDTIQLVRGMLFLDKDTKVYISNNSTKLTDATIPTDDVEAVDTNKLFYLTFHSGSTFSSPYPVSLNPDSPAYINNVLNTNPYKLQEKLHYLYADFPVDTAIADQVAESSKVAVLSGLNEKLTTGGDTTNTVANMYGRFETRYRTARTSKIISQPFGNKEYDLFHFEALDDGAYPSDNYKVSIRDLRASNDPNYKYGTFTVEIRGLRDTDYNVQIIDKFANCSLDPKSENYIAKVIGDQKIKLDLDVNKNDEKRLRVEGTFPNQSSHIRVVMSDDVTNEEIPDEALPFGFRGMPLLKTTTEGLDGQAAEQTNATLLTGSNNAADDLFADGGDPGPGPHLASSQANKLAFSVLPPVPYRFKVTKGDMIDNAKTYLGEPSDVEGSDSRLYWGSMTSRVNNIESPNNISGAGFNKIFENYSKFLGIDKFGTMFDIDSAEADAFNNNKFSLAKVAFSGSSISDLGNPFDEFKKAVYIRNAEINSDMFDSSKYTIDSSKLTDFTAQEKTAATKRATMAALLSEDPKKFNRYSEFAKFTTTFFGGFDGVNILDKDSYLLNDRATSTDTTNATAAKQGKARTGGFVSGLAGTSAATPFQGVGLNNNIVNSYNNAIRLMTDPMLINHNALAVPGIREPLIVDSAAAKVRDYGKAIYLMDIPAFDSDGIRLFGSTETDGSNVPDVQQTSLLFDRRGIDNNFVATYFPDVFVEDSGYEVEGAVKLTKVPASVAAMGALAKTDSVSSPWFAPAGFNRGGLSSTKATVVRLNSDDRDVLYEARINPISNFPNKQFVIFGQKTLQQAATSLDRVNVRRLLLEIKRRIELIAQSLLFSQNDSQTRNTFIERANNELSLIRLGQGIEDFRVIMDDTNNTPEDVDNNRLNGRIVFVPTRAVEFIAMDFIITNSGVSFE